MMGKFGGGVKGSGGGGRVGGVLGGRVFSFSVGCVSPRSEVIIGCKLLLFGWESVGICKLACAAHCVSTEIIS